MSVRIGICMNWPAKCLLNAFFLTSAVPDRERLESAETKLTESLGWEFVPGDLRQWNRPCDNKAQENRGPQPADVVRYLGPNYRLSPNLKENYAKKAGNGTSWWRRPTANSRTSTYG